MSYEQVQSQSEEAAGLLKLWGFLDCGDLWYELVASASRVNEIIKTPDWLLRLVENELEFLSSLQLPSHSSLVDAEDDTQATRCTLCCMSGAVIWQKAVKEAYLLGSP